MHASSARMGLRVGGVKNLWLLSDILYIYMFPVDHRILRANSECKWEMWLVKSLRLEPWLSPVMNC